MNVTAAGTGVPGHGALVYSGRDELISAAKDFFSSARAKGAGLFVAARSENLADLASSAGGDGSPVAVADLNGPSTDPGRIFALIRMFARDYPRRLVCCWQEVGWAGRPADELAEAMRYDALVNDAFAGSPVTIVCCYDRELGGEAVDDVQCVHSPARRADGTDGRFEVPLSRPPPG